MFNAMSLVDWSVAARALPGLNASGDAHFIKAFGDAVVVAVVDGLGHGDEATRAAGSAVRVLDEFGHEPILGLMQRCHEALLETRGVVMTMARFNSADQTITWLGIGNVEGMILRRDADGHRVRESVIGRGGVVGYQMPTLHAAIIPIRAADLLIFATDGIQTGFDPQVNMSDSPKQIARRIMEHSFKGTDDALVLAVRILRPGPLAPRRGAGRNDGPARV